MKTKISFSLALIFSLILNAQAQWVSQPTGLPATYGIQNVSAVDQNVVWANTIAVPQVPPTVMRTTNGGNTWTSSSLANLLPSGFFMGAVTAIDANTAWVSAVNAGVNSQSNIYKTTDGGLTWQHQPTAFNTGGAVQVIHFFDANNGVTFGSRSVGNSYTFEIYTTSNGGTNWVKVPPENLPPAVGSLDEATPAYAVLGNTIWVGVRGYRVYKSTDRGLTWIVGAAAPSFLSGGYQKLFGLAFSDASNGIANDEAFLYKTTDGGATWSQVNYSGPLHKSQIRAIPGSPGVYVSAGSFYFPWHAQFPTDDRGSSFSFDYGNTWVSLADTIAHTGIAFLNSTTGWTGGLDGMMHKFASSPLGIKKTITPKNSYYSYPNPCNGELTVSTAGKIPFSLEVYDVMGNRILQQRRNSFGKNSIDLSGQKKGVYLLHILSGEDRIIEKIVLQ